LLFIVAGVIKVLQGNASTYGHVQQPYPYNNAGYQAPVQPPPAAPGTGSNPGQVNNG
jgi:hypothetical protein